GRRFPPRDPDEVDRVWDLRFPFAGRWEAGETERRRTLRALGATHGLSFFFSSREEADPAIAAFRTLGRVIHRIEPGPTRNSGAWVYRVRWPYVTLWGLRRPGPVVEVVEFPD
ncbi:MAG: hypothetical protein ACF8XB_23750, partial [Planctomycetota bacterium JB042]